LISHWIQWKETFELENDNLTFQNFLSSSHTSKTSINRLVSKGCKLVGCGSAAPTLKVSNDDLAKIVDTSDEWISVRTGIRNRRVLSGQFLLVGHDGAIFWIVVNGVC
jgi:hypothetical protein